MHGSIRCILQLSCLLIWILFTQEYVIAFWMKTITKSSRFVGRCTPKWPNLAIVTSGHMLGPIPNDCFISDHHAAHDSNSQRKTYSCAIQYGNVFSPSLNLLFSTYYFIKKFWIYETFSLEIELGGIFDRSNIMH
jgi:hypothetical protein